MKILVFFAIILFAIVGQNQFVPVSVFRIKPPTGLEYNGGADVYFNKWYTISTLSPTLTNYDDLSSLTFSISPALPAGLSFNTSNGQITGTPTEYDISGTVYTVTASNQAGSVQDTFQNYIIAANHTWSGDAFPDTNWTTGGNWVGMLPPTSSDTVVFDSYCSSFGSGCNATIDTNITIDDLQLKSDYTGTLTQSGAFSMTIGNDSRSTPGGIVQEAGTFVGGSGAITVDVLQLSGGSFTSTSGTLDIGYNAQWGYTESDWVRAAVTWAHNNGTVKLTGRGSSSAYRQVGEIELDQKWVLYNFEFDIDSSTTVGMRTAGHHYDIEGTSGLIEVHNELHFRDGWGRWGDIDFFGTDARFYCDSPTLDECSDSSRSYNSYTPEATSVLTFKGSSAQTYTFDDEAQSWLRFDIDNTNGVTSSSTGAFSIAGLNIINGNFTAPQDDLYFYQDTNFSWRSNSIGFEIGATGSFSHNNGTVIFAGDRTYDDDRETMTLHDSATFYNLILDSTSNSTGTSSNEVMFASGVTFTVLNDFTVKDGRFDGNGTSIYIDGDYSRECSALDPNHICADTDSGTITYYFENSGSNINIASGADLSTGNSGINFIIDPGVGNTVNLNGRLTNFGSSDDLTITSGTLVIGANGGAIFGGDLINNGAITCSGAGFIHYKSSFSGTPQGGDDSACYGTAPLDATLDAMSWADFSGNSSEEFASGISVGVVVQISVVHTVGDPDIEFRSNHSGWTSIGNGGSSNQTLIPGESLQFRTQGSVSSDAGTITIINTDDSNTLIDTITATVP